MYIKTSVIMLRNFQVFFKILLFALVLASCQQPKPTVTLETEKGSIIIELYPAVAPKTVENFATLIGQKFYDNLKFHRYVPGFVIQGGCPKGDGTGGPGWDIFGEFQDPALLKLMPKHEKGVVSMARSRNPDSAGRQFYICLGEAPHLDGKYTSFGRVVTGIEIIDQLRKNDKMIKVTIDNYETN